MTPSEAAEACFAAARVGGLTAGLDTFLELVQTVPNFSLLAMDLYLRTTNEVDGRLVDYLRDFIKSADRLDIRHYEGHTIQFNDRITREFIENALRYNTAQKAKR